MRRVWRRAKESKADHFWDLAVAFLSGLSERTPVGPRWRKLAQQKIKEVAVTIQRAERLKSLLEHLLDCKCVSLQVCVERLSLSRELSLIAGSRRK